jgi:flagellar protein FliJ
MQRFRFPLDTLLRVNQIREDEAKREFAKALERLYRAREDLGRMQQEYFNIQQDEAGHRRGALLPQLLAAFTRYIFKVRGDIFHQYKYIGGLEQNVEARRQELVKARQKRRALETVKEKRWQEYRTERRKFLAKELDDAMGKKFIREKREQETDLPVRTGPG